MPRPHGLAKTGGRRPGSVNKAARELRSFLQSVFREAWFTDPEGRAALVAAVRTGAIDPRFLKVYLEYGFGAPSRELDVHHQGQVSLAQLVSGSVLTSSLEDEDDEDEDDNPGHVPPQNGSPRP